MGVIFQKKGKEMLKQGKILKNLGKNVQNLKKGRWYKKRQLVACNNHMQQTARIDPALNIVNFTSALPHAPPLGVHSVPRPPALFYFPIHAKRFFFPSWLTPCKLSYMYVAAVKNFVYIFH